MDVKRIEKHEIVNENQIKLDHKSKKLGDGDSKDVSGITDFDTTVEEARSTFYEKYSPAAPDGGWAWVVCLGSFIVNFILDGTMFSFGILMLALLDDLGYDKYMTAWIGSAQMGLSMAMGPVISLILQYFSIRQVTMVGTVIASTGFITSAFAPNIYVLIFTYGVVGGVGIGMVFLPAIIVVGLYFNKKRAIATGIATSGSGVGTFVYAYVTNLLLNYFSWRGTVLIHGGLILNCLVCAMCFRPLSLMKKVWRSQQECNTIDATACSISKPLIDENYSHTCKDLSNRSTKTDHVGTLTSPCHNHDSENKDEGLSDNQDKVLSDHLEKELTDQGDKKLKVKEPCELGVDEYNVSASTYPIDSESKMKDQHIESRILNTVKPDSSLLKHIHSENKDVICLPLADYHADHASAKRYQSLDYLQLIGSCSEDKSVAMSPKHCAQSEPELNGQLGFCQETFMPQPGLRDLSTTITHETVGDCHEVCPGSASISKALTRTPNRNLSLLKLMTNKVFLLLLLTFSMWTAQSITLTYLPDLAVSLHIQQSDAAFLISIIGIANVLGRLLAGFVTDCFHVPSVWLYFAALALASGINLIISFTPFLSHTLPVLQMCSAIFGLCMAVAVSMRTIVLADQLGIEALTVSFGVVAMFQGVAFSLDPPIAGQLIEDLDSFRPPFVMASLMYAVSAAAVLVVGCLSCRQSHQSKEEATFLSGPSEC
nr:monocarboxylate transporter 14-like [Biomphalaria glabrata]